MSRRFPRDLIRGANGGCSAILSAPSRAGGGAGNDESGFAN